MSIYRQEFIEFMVRSGVLTFGDFVTKSGRKTPYFINTGNYSTGEQLARLGEFYAESIIEQFGSDFNVVFGPAYKGIPLATVTAATLAKIHNRNISFCFNRKEAKDHGEGGVLVGHRLQDGDRIIIVEDVTTAGTSVRESVPILTSAAAVEIAGLIVSVDRMERGKTDRSALAELRDEFGIKTAAIVSIDDVIGHLYNRPVNGKVVLDDSMLERVSAYRAEYGASVT